MNYAAPIAVLVLLASHAAIAVLALNTGLTVSNAAFCRFYVCLKRHTPAAAPICSEYNYDSELS